MAGRGLATELVWILEENLCFERDRKAPGGFRLGFQAQFTPQPPDAPKDTYHHFADLDERLVFYRLGTNHGRSICLELCDEWFEPKGEADGYVRRDDWRISFFPGGNEEIEEITDLKRWQQRVVRGRPLSAVDFCMTIAALRELKPMAGCSCPMSDSGSRFSARCTISSLDRKTVTIEGISRPRHADRSADISVRASGAGCAARTANVRLRTRSWSTLRITLLNEP